MKIVQVHSDDGIAINDQENKGQKRYNRRDHRKYFPFDIFQCFVQFKYPKDSEHAEHSQKKDQLWVVKEMTKEGEVAE